MPFVDSHGVRIDFPRRIRFASRTTVLFGTIILAPLELGVVWLMMLGPLGTLAALVAVVLGWRVYLNSSVGAWVFRRSFGSVFQTLRTTTGHDDVCREIAGISRSIATDFGGAFCSANWDVIDSDFEGSRFARALVALYHPKRHHLVAQHAPGAAERARLFALRRERYTFDSDPWAVCPGWIRPPLSKAEAESLSYWPFASYAHYSVSLRDSLKSLAPEMASHIRTATTGNSIAMTAHEVEDFAERVSALQTEGAALYEQRTRLIETLPPKLAFAQDAGEIEPALRSIEARERAVLERAGFLVSTRGDTLMHLLR